MSNNYIYFMITWLRTRLCPPIPAFHLRQPHVDTEHPRRHRRAGVRKEAPMHCDGVGEGDEAHAWEGLEHEIVGEDAGGKDQRQWDAEGEHDAQAEAQQHCDRMARATPTAMLVTKRAARSAP